MTAPTEIPTATLKALAAHFKSEHPEVYLEVTGLPTWWDDLGPLYRNAEAKWLRYVRRNLTVAANHHETQEGS